MNKKIAVVVGAIALALSANAAPVVVPAPSCAGAAVNQMYAQAADQRILDKGDNTTVLWYIGCVVGLLGIAEAIEILIDR